MDYSPLVTSQCFTYSLQSELFASLLLPHNKYFLEQDSGANQSRLLRRPNKFKTCQIQTLFIYVCCTILFLVISCYFSWVFSRGYAKHRNDYLLGTDYANVSLTQM